MTNLEYDESGTNRTYEHVEHLQRTVDSPVSAITIMDAHASQSLAHFAAKFCNALEKNKTTICSPLSAETVLALLALASRNQTREELLQALGLPDDEAIRSTFTALASSIKVVKGVTLTMASKVYLRKEDNLKPEIKKIAEKVFCPRRSLFSLGRTKPSILEQLDFSDGNAAAAVVNEWVSTETNGLIKDMVSANIFLNTHMLLLSAIYFKGKWQTPFDKNLTAYHDFHVNKNTTIQVPSMHNLEKSFNFGVSADLKSTLLQLPYQGGEASMVIVLPDDIEGLDSVLQQLAAGHDLMADIEAMKKTEVIITIPKFKAEMTIDMKELLQKLGIKSIFDKETSEIDMLTSCERLSVSEAVQKAYIEVDEAGTTAAASTMVRRMICGYRNPMFTADRPFLYLLMWHKIPLFVGVYEGSAYAQKRQ